MRKELLSVVKLFLFIGFFFVLQFVGAQVLLDPVLHPKFVNPLPFPEVLEPTGIGGNNYKVHIQQTTQDLGLVDAMGNPLNSTTVWGYGPDAGSITFPGPTIEARSNVPITVDWVNQLPQKHLFAIDESIHWAGTDMGGKLPGLKKKFNGIPTVTHLHGGHNDAESDGHPESWYTPGFKYRGSNFFNKNKGKFYYDNSQEAATLWYHDHTIGITRLNVYAGLAGFYLLRDDHEDGLNLPKDQQVDLNDDSSAIEHFEIPLVIQDRVFDTQGQFVFPSETFSGTDPEGSSITLNNSILPEMFGDFILVNGKAWPYLDVQPRKYRLRLLNGSDSRFYNLRIKGIDFYQIGSDGGLLDAPIQRDKILIGPGERVDVIVDFSTVPGQKLVMRNNARSPYPFGDPVDPKTNGKVMAFKVGTSLTNPDLSVIPSTLRAEPFTVPGTAGSPRKLVLFEQTDEFGRLLPSLGTAEEGALTFMDKVTENPDLGATEVWEVYNTTADAHPVHLHLVHFQVINTQKFNVSKSVFGTSTNPLSEPVIKLKGTPTPPAPEDAGRKDTFIVYPGEVARVKAHFDKEGEYVWHCHILSHEDHDMMRPLYVGPMPKKYEKLVALVKKALVHSGYPWNADDCLTVAPNPFQQTTQIGFSFPENQNVTVKLYNLMGQNVAALYSGAVNALQKYKVTFDRENLPSGTYVCKLNTEDGQSFEKIIVIM